GASPVSWHGSHQADVLAYMTDHLGSTLAVVDWKRSLLETRDYGPFGRVIEHTGDLGLKHQFTGQPSDDTTGLQNYGARMYDARWARFLSPDERVQSFDSQGLNRYSYVSNQPTSMIDPGGEFALGFGGGFGGIGGMGGMSSMGALSGVSSSGAHAFGARRLSRGIMGAWLEESHPNDVLRNSVGRFLLNSPSSLLQNILAIATGVLSGNALQPIRGFGKILRGNVGKGLWDIVTSATPRVGKVGGLNHPAEGPEQPWWVGTSSLGDDPESGFPEHDGKYAEIGTGSDALWRHTEVDWDLILDAWADAVTEGLGGVMLAVGVTAVLGAKIVALNIPVGGAIKAAGAGLRFVIGGRRE
ncbi:MAG: RHS repeat-associated core domain-containing protein, partial [Myxococcota bacterium]|nr:RHS repeat-associated core domain-containing protein [Myxococcota bacterium]